MKNLKKKHVVHIGYYHGKEDIRIFCKECNTLASAGYRVSYITSDMYGDEGSFEVDGIRVSFYSYQNPAQSVKLTIGLEFFRNVFMRIKLKQEWVNKIVDQILDLQPDIVHIHEYETLFIANGLMRKCKNIKIIYDIHEDNPKVVGEWYRKNKRKIEGEIKALIKESIVKMREKRIIKKSVLVFTATDYLNSLASKYNEHVVTIKNYPKAEDIYCDNSDLDKRENNYCYAGRITENRGITVLIKNSDDIKGKFLLAGNMKEDYYRKLITEYSGYWNRNVMYQGHLSREQINLFYSLSVVGLCTLQYDPNFINALPIKLFEYMAAGIPVVCSNFPLWKKIVEEEKCGIAVDPYNENEIVNAVNFLLSDRKRAKQMGDNGKKAIKDKYSWAHEGDILVDAYKKYIG